MTFFDLIVLALVGSSLVAGALRGLVRALITTGAALMLGFAAGQLARGRLKRARLGWLDRALGALFGLARGLAVCAIMYLALTAFPVRLDAVAEARTAPLLAGV